MDELTDNLAYVFGVPVTTHVADDCTVSSFRVNYRLNLNYLFGVIY